MQKTQESPPIYIYFQILHKSYNFGVGLLGEVNYMLHKGRDCD